MRAPRGASSTPFRRCPRTPRTPEHTESPGRLDRPGLSHAVERGRAYAQPTLFRGATSTHQGRGSYLTPRRVRRGGAPGRIHPAAACGRDGTSRPRLAGDRIQNKPLRPWPSSPSSPQRHGAVCHCRRWHGRASCASDRVVIATIPWIRGGTREPSEQQSCSCSTISVHRAGNPAGSPDRRSARLIMSARHNAAPSRGEAGAGRSRGRSLAHRPPRRASAAWPADASVGTLASCGADFRVVEWTIADSSSSRLGAPPSSGATGSQPARPSSALHYFRSAGARQPHRDPHAELSQVVRGDTLTSYFSIAATNKERGESSAQHAAREAGVSDVSAAPWTSAVIERR